MNVALAPIVTLTLIGCLVITGSVTVAKQIVKHQALSHTTYLFDSPIVSVASSESTDPPILDTRTV